MSNTGDRPMSNNIIASSRLPSNRGNAVANRGHVVLPAVLDHCQQVALGIGALAGLAKKSGWEFGLFRSLDEAAIPPLRQMLARTGRMVGRWQQLKRPATRLDIVTAIALLLSGFSPDKDKDERTDEEHAVLQQLLCSDVAYEQPTVYELHEACHRVRKRLRFKSAFMPADLLLEFDKARAAGKRLQHYIDAIPKMRQQLDQYERDLPRLLIQRQRDAEQAEAHARKELRQRVAYHWPPLSPHDYDASELRRLGFDGMTYDELYDVPRDEVLARLDATKPNDEQDTESDDE